MHWEGHFSDPSEYKPCHMSFLENHGTLQSTCSFHGT